MDFRQLKWDTRYLRLAAHVASWSKDPSTKVGAVLVRPNNTVGSLGFNGFPPGHDDSPELYADREYKLAHVVHAEINALDFFGPRADGFSLYTSFPCCEACMERAGKEGVTRVVQPHLPVEGRSVEWIAEWTAKGARAAAVAERYGITVRTLRV